MVRVAVGFLLVCALVTFVNTARADGSCQEALTQRTGLAPVVVESAQELRRQWSTCPVEAKRMSYGQ